MSEKLSEPIWSGKYLCYPLDLSFKTYTSAVHEVVDSAFFFECGIDHVLNAIDIGDFDTNSDGRILLVASVGFACFSCFLGASFVAIREDDSNSARFCKSKSCVLPYAARSLDEILALIEVWKG
jgi:hypothetical protein